jgi:hypothetical protein
MADETWFPPSNANPLPVAVYKTRHRRALGRQPHPPHHLVILGGVNYG